MGIRLWEAGGLIGLLVLGVGVALADPPPRALTPPSPPSIHEPSLAPPATLEPNPPAVVNEAPPHSSASKKDSGELDCKIVDCVDSRQSCDLARRAYDRHARKSYRAHRGSAEPIGTTSYSLNEAIARCRSLSECQAVANEWAMGDDTGWFPAKSYELNPTKHGRVLIKRCR